MTKKAKGASKPRIVNGLRIDKRPDCPFCNSRDVLDRLHGEDSTRGEWHYGCSTCGRILVFLFKLQTWIVEREIVQLGLGLS